MVRNRLNALEILKLLPRTNCRECRLPTCMAFANAVAQGLKQPDHCPYLELKDIDQARDLAQEELIPAGSEEENLDELTRRVRLVAFSNISSRVGARLEESSLIFRCLGKEFAIEPSGRLRSQCHANLWVLIPLLDTIVRAAERRESRPQHPKGWIKFDELQQAVSRSDFFSISCEDGLRSLADQNLALFADILRVFGARDGGEDFDADLSLVIWPLPKVPLLICYWMPEDRFDSKLGVYFDRSANDHLSIEAIHILTTGLVDMLKRINTRHTIGEA